VSTTAAAAATDVVTATESTAASTESTETARETGEGDDVQEGAPATTLKERVKSRSMVPEDEWKRSAAAVVALDGETDGHGDAQEMVPPATLKERVKSRSMVPEDEWKNTAAAVALASAETGAPAAAAGETETAMIDTPQCQTSGLSDIITTPESSDTKEDKDVDAGAGAETGGGGVQEEGGLLTEEGASNESKSESKLPGDEWENVPVTATQAERFLSKKGLGEHAEQFKQIFEVSFVQDIALLTKEEIQQVLTSPEQSVLEKALAGVKINGLKLPLLRSKGQTVALVGKTVKVHGVGTGKVETFNKNKVMLNKFYDSTHTIRFDTGVPPSCFALFC
jgi:hypothetical protein